MSKIEYFYFQTLCVVILFKNVLFILNFLVTKLPVSVFKFKAKSLYLKKQIFSQNLDSSQFYVDSCKVKFTVNDHTKE